MTEPIKIKVLKLDPSASLPTYAHTGPLADLCADLKCFGNYTIERGIVTKVRTGIAFEFPPEYGALIEDRSGLAAKGVCTLGGVIDPGYRGEILLLLTNVGSENITIQNGDRIAQLRIVKRITADFVEVLELGNTERGSGGFGSTGL
jgi:dUTP pyrophosphatase